MTIWGQRSPKGPVHSKVVLQEGTAAPFMILYYIIAKPQRFFFSFFLSGGRSEPTGTFVQPGEMVINRVRRKRCEREDVGATGGMGWDKRWGKDEEGRGCESEAGMWRKISWVSLKHWFLATPSPRKLNIDQSHRPTNNEGDKEEY